MSWFSLREDKESVLDAVVFSPRLSSEDRARHERQWAEKHGLAHALAKRPQQPMAAKSSASA